MPAHCSGAMYAGVPSKVPAVVLKFDGVASGLPGSAKLKARLAWASVGAINRVAMASAAPARSATVGFATLAIPKSSTFTL